MSDPTREALELVTIIAADTRPVTDATAVVLRVSEAARVLLGDDNYTYLTDEEARALTVLRAALSTPPPSLDAASTRRYANGGNLPDPGTPAPILDIDRLARALCASRDPEVAATADLFIDDECRLLARRIAHEYARSDE